MDQPDLEALLNARSRPHADDLLAAWLTERSAPRLDGDEFLAALAARQE